jgi:integrase
MTDGAIAPAASRRFAFQFEKQSLAYAVEQRPSRRTEAFPTAEKGLGHSRPTSDQAHKRDLAMFNLAIDSKLRGCDLVSLRVDDIAVGGHVRDRATIIQRETGRRVQFEITEQTRASLQDWLNARPADRGPNVFSEPSPESTSCDSAPIRAHPARLDRGGRDGQQRLWHVFDAPHQGGADLPQDRQPASGPVASLTHEDREHGPLSWDRGR